MPSLLPRLLLLFLLIGCGPSAARKQTGVAFRDFFGLAFERPVAMAEIPGRPDHFLVVEQPGNIRLVRPGEGGGWQASNFLSLRVRGGRSGGDEQGLLGLAFHPRFHETRLYYVYYVHPDRRATVVAERRADDAPLRDAGTAERVLLEIPQPYSNHNGGTLGFGPDGFLYIGTGDGGGAGDPGNRAQDPGSLLGKMLRIDVDRRTAGTPYAVPSDNPFAGSPSHRPEIWALGLRNPWKWTFHPETGDLWAGDVGQGRREEISIVPRGGNLGWRIMEGDLCFDPEPCDRSGLTLPLVSLGRSEATSVTGGEFYTAEPASEYHGAYVFGDYGTGHVWALRPRGGSWERTRIGTVPDVSSFARDSRGRIFALGLRDGRVRLLEFP